MVGYWVQYIDSPPLSPELEERLKRQPGGGSTGKGPGSQYPEGIGWKVEKDRTGEWIPRPSGELNYQEALKWAALMNANRLQEPDEEEEEGEKGDTRGRRRRGGSSLESLLMKAVIDKAFPENGGSSAADERIRVLEEQLAGEREARLNERFDRLEAALGANAGGDPIEEMIRRREQMTALGMIPAQTAVNPGDSPTVAILKDSTDKLDKNMNRFVGIMERAMLRGHDEIIPEDRSTEAEQDDRAGTLLDKIDQNDRSRQLAKTLWGAR